MSHDAYQMQWSEAMNDLQEQVKVEQVPKEKNEAGVENCEEWPPEEFFQHFACLYIKYIEIYKKLEECYDQMVQPQKRATIKPVLEATMSRIALIKKDLADYNPRRGSIYVHLDQLLFDLKYDPSVIELPVPRYFKEDDQIPVDIKFREKPDEKKKVTKKKGKKKKKKPAGDVEEEIKPAPPSLEEKRQLLDNLLNEYCGTDEPEKEIVHDPFTLDMDIVQAIRIIQKNDRGRQYRDRIIKIVDTWKDYKENTGGVAGINPHAEELSIEEACIRFQKLFKGMIDRKRIEAIRNEELVFLGMAPKPKDITDKSQDPNRKARDTGDSRKATQIEKMKDYENAKEELKEEIKDNQGPDIQEAMIQERREWITLEIQKKGGTIPSSLEEFYKRYNVDVPLSPEEEELKKLLEEEDAKKKAKGKGKGKKDEKKPAKGKGKKGKVEDDGKEDIKLVGPPEEVQKFNEFQDDFNNKWANKDETENFEQDYDTEMVKEEVMPDIQKEFKSTVDKLIMMELENIKINQSGYKEKKKKGKKGKKGKAGKKKKAKDPEWLTWPKKIPGLKQIKKYSHVEDLLIELVQMGIAKKFPAQNLTDFRGDFNYLHSMMDDLTVGPQDPSMALIRQLVTESCIFPLGSKLVKERAQFVKSVLFYGPPGTGKTLVARAIVHETASMVFDLSPISIQGKYSEKKGEEKMIASVFACARHFQPAVVYIDECEKVFPQKKKKGKKGKKKKKADPGAPSRMKKAIIAWKKKLPQTDRILIIGCSSEPHEAVKKDMKTMWDQAIYFPFPDFSTRRGLWKEFIEKSGGIINQGFPLSTLAHISVGYSAGSILKTCQQVLTEYRVQQLRTRPLQLSEFIGPLSLTHYTLDDLYGSYRKFTDFITKDDKRRAAIESALKGDDDPGDKAKGKGKGKDKKGKGKKKKK
jgi:hypothetical protein